jgi:hypothetical protein
MDGAGMTQEELQDLRELIEFLKETALPNSPPKVENAKSA